MRSIRKHKSEALYSSFAAIDGNLLSRHNSPRYVQLPLTNHDSIVIRKFVLWNLEIERRRPLPYAPRDIVVRAVTRTEPSSKIACFADWHAAKMCADSQHDQPFGLLDAV